MPWSSLTTLVAVAFAALLAAIGFMQAPLAAALVATIVIVLWVHAIVVWMECDGAIRVFARGYVFAALIYASVAYSVGPSVLFREQILSLTQPLIQESLSHFREFNAESVLPSYLWVVHSYFCVLVGLAGGWSSSWLYRRRQKASQPSTEVSNP